MEVQHYASLPLGKHHYGLVREGECKAVCTECNLFVETLVHLLHSNYFLACIQVVHSLRSNLQGNIAPP